MKKTIIGILASVDAGKTTLSESILYLTGNIKKMGRVDHGDTYLDNDELEKQRGITIFSSNALVKYNDLEITFIDTPGHIDFSSEMERSLSIIDYAIVLLSGSETIPSYSKTIWKLLEYYNIPTFIFINKMDISYYSKQEILNNLNEVYSNNCIDFTNNDESLLESISLTSDILLNKYLRDNITNQDIALQIKNRQLFPVIFGSALKLQNVDRLLEILNKYIIEKEYGKEFKAIVYKLSYDHNELLTHIKITGGSLKNKTVLDNGEKINTIRKYSGNKYELVQIAYSGEICAITGVNKLKAGDTLGRQEKLKDKQLSSYMKYRVILDEHSDKHKMINNLRQLERIDPKLQLSIINDDIYLSLMGEVQIEVLKHIIKERYNEDIELDQGHIQYLETITKPVEGVGHYEPLRHYSEVHLLLEPLPRGSGIVVENKCNNDLAINYQNLIISHIKEKEHLGVLIGCPITDIKITLVSGKAHLKHSEGGDFREATYRAIRQGLMMSKSIILEPYYNYKLTIPSNYLSKAIYDLESKHASISIDSKDDISIITGSVSIKEMQGYQLEVISYTKGEGVLEYSFSSYHEVKDASRVIKEYNYEVSRDLDNPTGSIFCKHGAGFNVSYDKVYDYMHIPLITKDRTTREEINPKVEENLEEIFIRTYGPIKNRVETNTNKQEILSKEYENKNTCLLVDGYNVIFSDEELSKLAKDNLGASRDKLIDILSNYQGYMKCLLILVFDAYKVKGNPGSIEKYHNIYVVYTKEALIADSYIERVTNKLSKDYNIMVATSDALEQAIILGNGATRISSRQLLLDIKDTTTRKYQEYQENKEISRNYLLEDLNKK